MTKYGSNVVVIEVDDTGGTPRDISQHVTEFNGMDIEALLEESHSFGDSWVEQLFSGVSRFADISIKGFYDDAATTGPDVVFQGGQGETRSVKVTWGGAKDTEVEAVIKNYRRFAVRGESQKYEAILSPTGAPTEN